jgi:hypothetical protein
MEWKFWYDFSYIIFVAYKFRENPSVGSNVITAYSCFDIGGCSGELSSEEREVG